MEKIKGGYILQPRCFDSSESAHFPPCTREVWFFILRNVNHADNGKFKRGSAFFNFTDIQNALSWVVGYRVERYSKPQLTKAMRRLHEGNMIETAKATRGVFVTVLNYDKYQDPSLYEGNGEGNTKETRRKHEGEYIKQEERMKEEINYIGDAKKVNGRFVRPSLEEVTAYCLERGNGLDPQYFIDSNDSKGWVVGKAPMKDWKAAIRTWEKNAIRFSVDKKSPKGEQVVGGLTF